MRSNGASRSLGAAALLVAAACATVDPRPDYEQARREIQATTGVAEIHDPDQPVLSDEEIRAMLSDGLGSTEATRLALLNNRRLHAGFSSLGVARADFVQAGLLANPSLSFAFLFPDVGGRTRWIADLAGNVTDIWQLPSRQALAQAGLAQRILELSLFAGELVAAVRVAYFESVAAREARSVAGANAGLARRSLDGVRRQVELGLASTTDEALARNLALAAELSHQRTERAEASALRELAARLSLEDDLLAIALTDPLPEPRADELDRERLITTSLASRADLRAAERAVAGAEERVELERDRRVPDVSAGIAAERPETGAPADLLIGPVGAIELPIFDQNQAQVSRAEYELAARRQEYEALTVEIRQELRAALDVAAVSARAAAFARDELVPQAERSASLAERSYALGESTILALLQSQRAALEARRTGIEARLEAALAWIELERAAGAPLPGWTDEEGPP